MIDQISRLCEINPNQINIKGKTTEKLGVIGKGKAIASEAITLDTSPSHTYAVAGDYTVIISGTFPSIKFSNAGDKTKILSISNLGAVGWTSLVSAFNGCSNIGEVYGGDTSNVTSMANMFKDATSATPDTSGWNTSNVTAMNAMFIAASAANPDVSSWNTSNVTSMNRMFQAAASFNQDIGTKVVTVGGQTYTAWDVSNVNNMKFMFRETNSFNGPIWNWNTSSVLNMRHMFSSASSFNHWIGTKSVTVGGQTYNAWDVSSVTNMSAMFSNGAPTVTQDIGNWDTSSVTNMSYMFFKTPIGYNNSWDISEKVVTVGGQTYTAWDVSNVQTMDHMFQGYNMFTSYFNDDISNWNTSSLVDINAMFHSSSAFDQNIGSWDVSNVTNAYQMFNGIALSIANYDSLLIGWESQNLQNNVVFSGGMSNYCNGDSARTSLINNNGWTIYDGTLDCTASIDDESIMHVSLYPNPVSDVLNIRGNTTELSIVIYDILGKQIMRSRIMNSPDISLLDTGEYFVKLSDGKYTTTRKLIKN